MSENATAELTEKRRETSLLTEEAIDVLFDDDYGELYDVRDAAFYMIKPLIDKASEDSLEGFLFKLKEVIAQGTEVDNGLFDDEDE